MAAYRVLLAAPVVGLLLLAAWYDLATRTIPDPIAIAIASVGGCERLLVGVVPLAVSAAIALAFGLLLVVLHARGLLGGGDVKLAAATCLGLSVASAYRFILVTALAGGVLALLHLILRRKVRRAPAGRPRRGDSPLARICRAERWRIARHGSLPYGVAIAAGGICAVLGGPGN